nr:DUF4062 domain-containing protein [Pyxidicoccus caerfyrddinensis]
MRVFISSTYSDLREYREAVVSTLRRFALELVSLEDLGAADQTPLEASFDAIETSDIVVVLVAWRLGYVPPESRKSLVEREYEKSIEAGKPTFCFLLDEEHPWPVGYLDPDPTRIKAFRQRLLAQHIVGFFTTQEDLAAKVAIALSRYSHQVEGISAAPPPPKISDRQTFELAGLMEEFKTLRAELSVLRQSVADVLRQSSAVSASSVVRPSRGLPAEFLGPPAAFVEVKKCFVIMPYSEKWSGAVERIILEVCSEVGLEFQIAKNMEGRFVPNDIWRGITGSGVIVADLSTANPNVTYEIGLADVMGKEVMLIAQQATPPFDFLAQRIIFYENSLSGSLALREELKGRLQRYKARCETQESV